MKYIISTEGFYKSFFPENLDTADMIEITEIGNSWKKYIDPKTGEIHDSEKYYNDYINNILTGDKNE